jgi:hypothetical protein
VSEQEELSEIHGKLLGCTELELARRPDSLSGLLEPVPGGYRVMALPGTDPLSDAVSLNSTLSVIRAEAGRKGGLRSAALRNGQFLKSEVDK